MPHHGHEHRIELLFTTVLYCVSIKYFCWQVFWQYSVSCAVFQSFLFPSPPSNRQPRPTSSTSPGGHRCVWGALSPSTSTPCGLRGRGGCRGSLQRPLRRRRPPLGPQGLSRERSAAGNASVQPSAFIQSTYLSHLPKSFFQLWPSMTIPRTRRTSCPSWKEQSSI